MTVLEIGFVKNGLLIYHQVYHLIHKNHRHITPERRSQLINQIYQMGTFVLQDEIEFISMKNFRIYVYSIYSTNKHSLLIYCIADPKSDRKITQNLLHQIAEQFRSQFPDSQYLNLFELQQYHAFQNTLNEILHDERLLPKDRIQRFLIS
ncbi:MAG: hypothetical protein K9W44_07600 [Candidatus Lokiarchaeota archaeon]|nr:hypothetical protein [Candidatus Harpocratesius repetitus]